MSRLGVALGVAVALTGCVGQLRDFVGPVHATTSPQLLRFGLDVQQSRCVGDKLGEQLRPRQLRMFARAASAVGAGWFEPGRLTVRDLLYLADHESDRAVKPALERAFGLCSVTVPAPPPPRPEQVAAAAPATPAGPAWLNLGAATSGQLIAIDAATIRQDDSHRSAWFRLTDPPAAAPAPAEAGATHTGARSRAHAPASGPAASPPTPPSAPTAGARDSFLLEIDCARRTINAKARERRDAAGALLQHVDYPDNPLHVEGGTVMEIAWLSLCT